MSEGVQVPPRTHIKHTAEVGTDDLGLQCLQTWLVGHPEPDAAVQLRLVPRVSLPEDTEEAAEAVDQRGDLIFVESLWRAALTRKAAEAVVRMVDISRIQLAVRAGRAGTARRATLRGPSMIDSSLCTGFCDCGSVPA